MPKEEPQLFEGRWPLEEYIQIVHQRLKAPFPPSEMEARVGQNVGEGQAIPLFYIDTRAAIKRLDQVFGLGNYSIITKPLSMGADQREVTNYNTKETSTKSGLLVAATVEIAIHTPYLTCTVSNVGEKGLDEQGHNKATSAWAQALKRAATSLGVGSFLYYMGVKKPFPLQGTGRVKGFWDIEKLPLDDFIPAALKECGFRSICEVTEQEVPWRIAAQAVHYTGRVLCKEEAKKVLEELGLRKKE